MGTTAAELKRITGLGGAILKSTGPSGQVTAIVNTGGVRDLQGDTMLYGCWRKVIMEQQKPSVCWAHDVTKILGSVIHLEELPPGSLLLPANQRAGGGRGTASGLLVRLQMQLKTQAGREAFILLGGEGDPPAVRQWSVQFDLDDKGAESDGKGGRNIREVAHLYEVSPVLVGASPDTATLAFKSAFARAAEPSRFSRTLLRSKIRASIARSVRERPEFKALAQVAAQRAATQAAARVHEALEADRLAVAAMKTGSVLRLTGAQVKMLRDANRESVAGRLYKTIDNYAAAGSEGHRRLLWSAGEGIYY